jgi:DNA-directed RNA polymerase
MDYFLHECIKPAFYDMYKDGDVLQKFLDEVTPLIPEKSRSKIPAIPELGSLDISEVLNSEFFFS